MNTRDTRMVERAIREGWNIPERVLEQLPLRMLQIVMDSSKSTRNQLAAARVLTTMHGQNVGLKVDHKHVHAHATTEELRREMFNDPAYLEWLRNDTAGDTETNSNPRALCGGDEPGEVATSEASAPFG